MNSKIGFAVLYRWRIQVGMESRFQQAWELVTKQLMRERGALGSRLHRSQDGWWIAYAQWPTQEAWEKSQAQAPIDDNAFSSLSSAIVESLEPLRMQLVSDHLLT